jgi:hypothetical protein
MMKHKLFAGVLIFAMGVLVSGCNLPLAASASDESNAPRAWFDAPLPNSVFHPPNPICQIVAHGASPNGIAAFELSINGSAISIPSPDTQSSLVMLTRDCGLSRPGEYLLQMRVQDNAGQWSGFAETSLIIVEGETPTATLPATEAPATETPTQIFTPTSTPTVLPAGGVTIESISTDMVYLGRASCGTLDVTITARATAPKGIKVVVLFYRFFTGGSAGEFQSVAMNPIGGDLYQRTLNPTSLLGGVPFEQATLQYQIVIQQNDGDVSIRTPLLADIAVQACGSVNTAPVCSSYTDQRSCVAHGCNWVEIPGIVPIYECRNP